MESKAVPYFNFLWIPSKGENTQDKNELLKRVQQYTNTMELLRAGSPVSYDFRIVLSLEQLVTCLRPMPGHLPVFVLLGHGYSETGAMAMWNGDMLEPTALLKKWQCNFKCDIIATACGANVFVSPLQYPILLYYNRQCRFLAAAEPLAHCSYMVTTNGQSSHLELTQLMLHYLRVYDDGGQQVAVKKADAFVQANRRTAKQRRVAQELADQTAGKARIELELAERAKQLAKASADKEAARLVVLKKWAADVKAQWQRWGQERDQHSTHVVALERWRTRWFCVFALFVFFQLLDVLGRQGPLFSYVVLDLVLYCTVLRK
jgi:hypothetical protein